MVCSREAPPVPQPLQLHMPPDTGCGPRMAELPSLRVAEDVRVQVPLTFTYGVMAVGVQVWARRAVGPVLAPRASTKVDKRSLMVLPFG